MSRKKQEARIKGILRQEGERRSEKKKRADGRKEKVKGKDCGKRESIVVCCLVHHSCLD